MIEILLTVLLLSMMEVALSFDNAVLNARILQNMSAIWQRRFLTWGILVAVVGMRLIFPILIVVVASGASVMSIVNMVIYDPAQYGQKLHDSHISIAAFGGMFLLMVYLEFMFDPENGRSTYWLGWIEKKLVKLGLLKGMEVIIATAILVGVQYFVPTPEERLTCLISGLFGIGLYMLIQAVMGFFETEETVCVNKIGLMAFLYLEVLDASCSLDGVIGAFAMTNNILIIMIGLGIGAFAVRSLTVYLVRGGVLKEYVYLEHGAHYGIGALATIMLVSIFQPVPELVTGTLGIGFIGLSLLSSIRARNAK